MIDVQNPDHHLARRLGASIRRGKASLWGVFRDAAGIVSGVGGQPLLDGVLNFALDTGHDTETFLVVSKCCGSRRISNNAHLGKRRGGCQSHYQGRGAG